MDEPMVVSLPGETETPAIASLGGLSLEEEHAVVREMLDHMEQGVVLYERIACGDEVVAFFNARAEGHLELPAGMLRAGLPRRAIVDLCEARGDHGSHFEVQAHIAKVSRGESAEVLCRKPSGRWVLARSIPRTHAPGSLTLYIDVTERVLAEEELRKSRAQYQAIAEMAPLGFVQLDSRGRVVFANPAARRTFAIPEGEIDLLGALRPCSGRTLTEELATSGQFEAELRLAGELRHLMVAASPAADDAADRIVAFTDITPLKTANRQVERMARSDPLTGLGNRTLLRECWAELQAEAEAGKPVVFIALDLDHFKLVNDDYGHETGDGLLQMAAQRMREVCGTVGQAFRLGGDEFAVILNGTPRDEGIRIAEDLVDALSKPYRIAGRALTVGCSAGLASLPDDGKTPEGLQRAADIALYQVKRNGRNAVACYDARQEEEVNERRRLEADLALALSRQDFSLVYQPQVDLGTGRLSGIEALIRWNNRRLGRMVPPAEFIPIAEKTGLITLLDNWVIRRAVAELRAFVDADPHCPGLSINLSPVSLATPHILEGLLETLDAHQLAPGLIEIEVTEGMSIGSSGHLIETLTAFQKAGIRIAIDDFGAGQTSLTYIRSLPVDRVKIDRSIISGLGSDRATDAIVASIHDLCRRLDLRMTAEGIETERQWEELRKLGSVDGQGFYLSQPESAEAIIRRLSGRQHARPSAAASS